MTPSGPKLSGAIRGDTGSESDWLSRERCCPGSYSTAESVRSTFRYRRPYWTSADRESVQAYDQTKKLESGTGCWVPNGSMVQRRCSAGDFLDSFLASPQGKRRKA